MAEDGEAPRAPQFECVAFNDGVGDAGQLGFWCPWCEAPHWHGTHEVEGPGIHCVGDRRSPLLSTGYELRKGRQAAAGADRERILLPPALMVEGPPLRSMLARHAHAFRAAIRQALLSVSARAAREGVAVRSVKGRGSVAAFEYASWMISPAGDGAEIIGRGFLRLAALLYGVPAGVAAVRILEAVTWETLDAEAALAVQSAVDAWVARGAPERGRAL